MKNIEKKRVPYLAIAAIAALVAFGVITVAGSAAIFSVSADRKVALDGMYDCALYDACDSVNNLEINLSKLMVASGKKDSLGIINDVCAEAELAESSISRLPVDPDALLKTGKYLNQVADWARTYSSAVLSGKDVAAFSEQAEQLYTVARSLNVSLKELAAAVDGRGLTAGVGENLLLTFDVNLSLRDMEENGIDYPELIYDGPFSDAKKYCFRALEDLPEITAEQGAEIASSAGIASPVFLGRTEGKTPAFEFGGSLGGHEAHASISVKGGKILGLDLTREVGAVAVSERDAMDSAVRAAAALGYDGLSPVWYNSENGVGFVNLAPVVGGVTYYTDLVKVKVALDNADFLGLEATGWCSAHHARDLHAVIDEDTARALVSPRLEVVRVSLAVIPHGEDERFCFEVYGTAKGLDYFVYLDATTGEQADVLRVVDSSQGSLVM